MKEEFEDNFIKLDLVANGNTFCNILDGLLVDNDWLEYTDKFGRKWKLVPNTNENIMMPFIITPLPKEG